MRNNYLLPKPFLISKGNKFLGCVFSSIICSQGLDFLVCEVLYLCFEFLKLAEKFVL
jgi:hypothetical protein